MAKPKVDRGAGLLRLALALVLLLSGGAYALLGMADAEAEQDAAPKKPGILRLDSQRDRG